MKYIEKSDNFFVNELGEVFREGKKLTPHSSGAGDKYYRQRIYNLDGTVYRKDIHRLVAETWLPNPNNLPCVNHKNGNKRDNRVSNLEWCTFQHNNQHAFDTGLNGNVLEGHHRAVLTNTEIHELCKLMQDGGRNCEIANNPSITASMLSDIKARRRWVEISKDYNF